MGISTIGFGKNSNNFEFLLISVQMEETTSFSLEIGERKEKGCDIMMLCARRGRERERRSGEDDVPIIVEGQKIENTKYYSRDTMVSTYDTTSIAVYVSVHRTFVFIINDDETRNETTRR